MHESQPELRHQYFEVVPLHAHMSSRQLSLNWLGCAGVFGDPCEHSHPDEARHADRFVPSCELAVTQQAPACGSTLAGHSDDAARGALEQLQPSHARVPSALDTRDGNLGVAATCRGAIHQRDNKRR